MSDAEETNPIDYIAISGDMGTNIDHDRVHGYATGSRTVEVRATRGALLTFVQTDAPVDPADPDTIHLSSDGMDTLVALLEPHLLPVDGAT